MTQSTNATLLGMTSIPPLSASGILPAGRHICTLEDIRVTFAHSGLHPYRTVLFENLERFVAMLREVNFFPCLYIDGSFTTDKSAPQDIDVCVQLPDTTPESKARLESDSNINLALDPKECKRLYTIDVIYWHPRFPTHHLQNVALFERLKPDDGVKRKLAADTRKGILKVIL